MKTKICKKCGEEKPLEEFGKRKRNHDGLQHNCKLCWSEYHGKYSKNNREQRNKSSRKYRAANKEKVSEWGRNWRESNKDRVKELKRKYRVENKDSVTASNRKQYEANREERIEYQRDYRDSNKESIKERRDKRREENREEMNARERRWAREKRQTDPDFVLKLRLRNRLNAALKGNRNEGSAVRDLGMTIPEFRRCIESLFDDHMTWDNHGRYWHLDHIFPLNAANLDDRVEFLAVNNWRNIQPLESIANLEKHDTITPEAQKLFNKLKKEFRKKQAG